MKYPDSDKTVFYFLPQKSGKKHFTWHLNSCSKEKLLDSGLICFPGNCDYFLSCVPSSYTQEDLNTLCDSCYWDRKLLPTNICEHNRKTLQEYKYYETN